MAHASPTVALALLLAGSSCAPVVAHDTTTVVAEMETTVTEGPYCGDWGAPGLMVQYGSSDQNDKKIVCAAKGDGILEVGICMAEEDGHDNYDNCAIVPLESEQCAAGKLRFVKCEEISENGGHSVSEAPRMTAPFVAYLTLLACTFAGMA